MGADMEGEAGDDRFGWSVSLSAFDSEIVVIGAINNNGHGHVRVFKYDLNIFYCMLHVPSVLSS